MSSLLVLLVLPAGAARAATAGVEPFVESPEIDPFGSCSRYMTCPPDMLVFRAAAGESNRLTIREEPAAYPRTRYIVWDERAPVHAGAGCEQIDANTAACLAGAIGPVELGDIGDRVIARWGEVSGGAGDDVLEVQFGRMDGDAGGDVLVGGQGEGGGGDDVLTVISGTGDSGDDVLSCLPPEASCGLDGGPGDDLLRGGAFFDRLLGRAGEDVLLGLGGEDRLEGGRGADRLDAGGDRAAGRDRVDCGGGRDQALADRRDRVTRCERVSRRRP